MWKCIIDKNRNLLRKSMTTLTRCISTAWDISKLAVLSEKPTMHRLTPCWRNLTSPQTETAPSTNWQARFKIQNLKTSLKVYHSFKCSVKDTGPSSLKLPLSHLMCSPVLKWSDLANKYIFSACSSPWTTLHDIVHGESENKYGLISCNFINEGWVFFKR